MAAVCCLLYCQQLKRGLERRDSLEEVKAQGIYIDTDAAQVWPSQVLVINSSACSMIAELCASSSYNMAAASVRKEQLQQSRSCSVCYLQALVALAKCCYALATTLVDAPGITVARSHY
jgi:hypothetical protein